MGTGILSDQDINQITLLVKNTRGDFAEVGVFRGRTFRKLILIASNQNKITHAFDSFRGMNAPTEMDGVELGNKYYEGRFDIGGKEKFTELMIGAGLRTGYELWDGFIPECFNKCPIQEFSFVYIDVDHYIPTAKAIEWIWPRVVVNGIMGFDDYTQGYAYFAPVAIDNFLREQIDNYEIVLHNKNNQIFVKRIK